MKIPFNKPYLTGKEVHYLYKSVQSGHISGNGLYTKKCQKYFEEKYNITKCLLTTSCTDALEMTALLINIKPGDEVIMPAYTFVSTANAFVLRGAKIVFADSCKKHPNIDPLHVETLINKRTKAIIVVHYSGIACNMDEIMKISNKHNLYVIEDAAQAIDSFFKGKPLGSIGHFGTFSFHETKNVISGEGGMLAINDESFINRAEIIWEKGTNRAAFFRGEIDKYGWVDIGSSFLPSDVIGAFLYAQLEQLENIQSRRLVIWNQYYSELEELEKSDRLELPKIPDYATNNAHIFYLVLDSLHQRQKLIKYLKENNVHAVFHYLPLHQSPFYEKRYSGQKLINCNRFADCLVRLPLYYELTKDDVIYITSLIKSFMYSS